MSFIPKAVSRLYRKDWQFALDIARLPVLPQAALIISVMPILVQYVPSVILPKSIWLTWTAAFLFVIAYGLLRVRCPKFILEYRDFGQYAERQHSHRWIVWEFYNNIKSLENWEITIQELIFKKLTIEDSTGVNFKPFSFCGNLPLPSNNDEIQIFRPVNHGRDIFLPFYCSGKRVLLPMQESDPERHEKEKELFWILYTQATKERKYSRSTFWILIYAAIAIFVINILFSVWRTLMS